MIDGKSLRFETQEQQTRGSMSEKLTERQKRFIDYYIQYGNGAKAAREAGYSEKSARREASRLMKRLMCAKCWSIG